MPAATSQERAQMDRAEASLEAQMVAAEQYAAEVRGGWFITDAQRSVLKNITDERARFNTWRTAWKQWALDGHEPGTRAKPGQSYPVSFWLRIGNDIASALKAYSKGLYNADVFTIVKDTVKESGKDLAKLPTPSAWPTWAKVLAGVVVVGAVVVTINNVAAITRGLRGAT